MKKSDEIGQFLIIAILAIVSGCAFYQKRQNQEVAVRSVYPESRLSLNFNGEKFFVWERDTVPYHKRKIQVSRHWKSKYGEFVIINCPRNESHGLYSVLLERSKNLPVDSDILEFDEIKNTLDSPYAWSYPNDQISFSKDSSIVKFVMLSNKGNDKEVKMYWDCLNRKWFYN